MLMLRIKLWRRWHSHPATFGWRLALVRLRCILRGGPEPIRFLLIHDGDAYTSEQQAAPFLRHALPLRRARGLVTQFVSLDRARHLSPERLRKFAIVGLKFCFKTPDGEVSAYTADVAQALKNSQTRLVYFDGDDDLNVQWPAVLARVDQYVKKHAFADKADYARHYIGKGNLTDYVARTYGTSFAEDIIPVSGGLDPALLEKVYVGWNIALDDKIQELSERKLAIDNPPRSIDIACRAHVAQSVWTYPMRHAAMAAIEQMADRWTVRAPRVRVSQEQYYQEMLSSRICVSPFGFGELCWRDFEAMLCGCLLVKPDMSHLRTRPDLFVPHETYVPVRWDYGDLEAQCLPYLHDEARRRRVAMQARQRLLESLRPEWFMRAVDDWLHALGMDLGQRTSRPSCASPGRV